MEHPLIATNPGIEGGKPIIKGTRITVEMLADEYAAGGLIVAGGTLETFLAACGGNVGSGATTPTPGVTPIGNAGLKTPGFLQWGSDFVDGAPFVFKDPKNPANLIGFEVDIMQAVANLMSVTPQQVETCYGQLDQALATNNFDFVFNGWEITDVQKTLTIWI